MNIIAGKWRIYISYIQTDFFENNVHKPRVINSLLRTLVRGNESITLVNIFQNAYYIKYTLRLLSLLLSILSVSYRKNKKKVSFNI